MYAYYSCSNKKIRGYSVLSTPLHSALKLHKIAICGNKLVLSNQYFLKLFRTQLPQRNLHSEEIMSKNIELFWIPNNGCFFWCDEFENDEFESDKFILRE